MKIEVKARLFLTMPNPKKGESIGDIMLMAEQFTNQRQFFTMPKTKTKVGIRMHVEVGRQIK